MRWSWEIGRPFGIPVRVHATFLILLGVVLFTGEGGKPDPAALLILLVVFASVVLHELGHSLAARAYGIVVRDITLWPLGGIARLERIPEQPGRQVVIAAAGPAVSFALAGLIAVPAFLLIPDLDPKTRAEQILWYAAEINLMLGLFNLLPALPMDGGRILRGVLAMTSLKPKATYIAARVGQAFAIALAVGGLALGRPWLAVIAVFVFLTAEQEWRSEHVVGRLRSVAAWQAMLRPVATAGRMTSIGSLADFAQQSEQRDFPVTEGGSLVGLVTRWDLVQAVLDGRREDPVFTIMDREIPTIAPHETLDHLLPLRIPFDRIVLPVVDRMRVVGLLTPERLAEVQARG
ncbi:MAG: site-2 protease family protein [Deltaproteobacteria bacterium]|nr:site-2 protease family protein [Deltaproteobacteria bacterium]